jgi:hypothetical protein
VDVGAAHEWTGGQQKSGESRILFGYRRGGVDVVSSGIWLLRQDSTAWQSYDAASLIFLHLH